MSLVFISSCVHIYTAHGVYYRMKAGESLPTIAERYRVSLQEVAENNNIEKVEEVHVGQSIFIPGVTVSGFASIIEEEKSHVNSPAAKKEGKKENEKEGKRERKIERQATKETSIKIDRGRFRWPVSGEVSSNFGIRKGRRHDGVDIRAERGTPVFAAADGTVVYSKRMRGYGNLILLKHKDDFFTVYAHNSVNLVKKGNRIKVGQKIAKVGRTGRATGPHLHFEVRKGLKARNPLFFLPKKRYAKK